MNTRSLRVAEPPSEATGAGAALFHQGSAFAPVHRTEIHGIDDAMRHVDHIAASLRHYRAMAQHGADPEGGVVFYGPPGTGKTLAARYLATVTGSLFIDAAAFFRLEGGCTAKTVHLLFSNAADACKASGDPVILFWDEFTYDRADQPPSDRTREIVNQLLTELSGAEARHPGVLLVVCTNHVQWIDNALARAGRLGAHVAFACPDDAGRAALLKHYASQRAVTDGIDYRLLAEVMHGDLSAAGCERVIEVAWRACVLRAVENGGDPVLDMDALVAAAAGAGQECIADECEDDDGFGEAWHTAVHEAGHAIAAHALGVPVFYAEARGDRGHVRARVRDAEKDIIISLAGVSATDVLGLKRGAGHCSDLKSATTVAKRGVDTTGVGARTGFVNLLRLQSHPHPGETGQIADATLADRDADVREIMESGHLRAREIVVGNVAALEALAEALRERGQLLRPEIAAILEEHGVGFGSEAVAVFGGIDTGVLA